MQICKGKTKTDAACRAPASAGGLCYFHANPNRAKTLGQIGGRKNRRSAVDLEVPDNMTAADLSKVTGEAIRLLLSGELGAREASAFAQLCNSLYRIIPAADLETRVATLERQIAEDGQATQPEGGIAPESDSTGSPTDQVEADENNESVEEEGQATQPEGGIAPDSDSTGSPTDQIEAAESNDSVEAEQEGPCAEATMEDEEEAEGTSDGSDESEEP
ncbi:MAG: hypothetical protein WB623_01415 [Candidatus Sulfotelmatobacter sp.]|jgi:hypothetical protein